jgi:hypothetical protein
MGAKAFHNFTRNWEATLFHKTFYILGNLIKTDLGFECGVPGHLTQSVPYTLPTGVFMSGPSILGVSLSIVDIHSLVMVISTHRLELEITFHRTVTGLHLKVDEWGRLRWRQVFDYPHIVINRVDDGIDVALERVACIFRPLFIHEFLNFRVGVTCGIANPSFYEILFEGRVR